MDDNTLVALHKQHRAEQGKYVYLLLAVAASAVGFAVQKTTGVGMQWSQLPLAVATGLWGTSFYCGCRHLLWSQATLAANSDLIKFKNENKPELAAAARSAMIGNAGDAECYAKWQFRLLMIGAVSFLLWHVLEMFLLT